MRNNSPARRWRRAIVRLAVVVAAVVGIWIGGQVRWIGQRREFVSRHESLAQEADQGRLGQAVTRGHSTRPVERWSTADFSLRLWGEPPRTMLRLILFVDDPDDPLADVKRAEQLFPEAAEVQWEGYRRNADHGQ